jgi:hypothetical protein
VVGSLITVLMVAIAMWLPGKLSAQPAAWGPTERIRDIKN